MASKVPPWEDVEVRDQSETFSRLRGYVLDCEGEDGWAVLDYNDVAAVIGVEPARRNRTAKRWLWRMVSNKLLKRRIRPDENEGRPRFSASRSVGAKS